MRKKKTAPQTHKHRKASFPKQPGLIAQGETAQQSATTKSTLDNRSHRTSLRFCCAANVVTAGVAREPDAYRDCSNRLLGGTSPRQ